MSSDSLFEKRWGCVVNYIAGVGLGVVSFVLFLELPGPLVDAFPRYVPVFLGLFVVSFVLGLANERIGTIMTIAWVTFFLIPIVLCWLFFWGGGVGD